MASNESSVPQLGVRGTAFYKAAIAGFELTDGEMELLEASCQTLDEIDELQSAVEADGVTVTGSTGQTRVHPAIAELRQHRLALGRLLSQLALPDLEGGSIATPQQVRGRTAAQKRWAAQRG